LAQAQALTAKDLIWIKDRANSNNHQLIDVVRGANALHTNNANVESAYVAPSGNSVAWAWKAGGAPVANTDGSIASQVSANKCAGFSIVKYNGNTGTVGHGLGVAPSMVIFKKLSATQHWEVGHSGLNGGVNPWNYVIELSDPAGQSAANRWGNTAPTATVFTLGSDMGAGDYVAYCFAPIPGMSAFGSLTGNGSADGPFCYLGFRPRFIMIKRTDAAGNWYIYDTSRDTYNQSQLYLGPNIANAEQTVAVGDILSNGFKVRQTIADLNASSASYIYAAWSEAPFKISNAR
jgi:hypothetical protein